MANCFVFETESETFETSSAGNYPLIFTMAASPPTSSVRSKSTLRIAFVAAEAVAAVEAEAAVSSAVANGLMFDSEDDSDTNAAGENGAVEINKMKQKKPKKPKVTVAEAALKIDAGDLSAFLIDITTSYETQQDMQLMRFADYFGRAFASVSAAQFPWLNIFKESTVSKLVDIPLSNVPEDVYKVSVDW
ncbi:hypothetical protein F3Y22_tig00111810pilonHSYRG00257 [Hibiscus syriacus]|uniref:Uncharacterized protein n=1 Tax=Hibiscus syriacus TaxID=106335 RepID=A0A6A2XBZ5_HIBSY|nr:hypothetical protein F3Y22_tig00111810pilonHSYRG00257 [Hibiscus syriacus]